MNPDTTTDWLGVIAAWIAALAAVGTVLLTAGLLWAAWRAYRTASGTLRQMKEDSEAQREDSARATRPYVGIRIAPSIGGSDTWDLILHNSGRTSAHGLRMDIEPDGADDPFAKQIRRLAQSGQTLHPGSSLRSFWKLEASKPGSIGFGRATVTVHYSDSEGTPYSELPVVLDPNDMGHTPMPDHGPETDDEDTGRDIVLALRAIARNVGEGNR